MDIATVVVTIQSIVILGSIGVIIYLIAKRVKEKKEETFEKRDN